MRKHFLRSSLIAATIGALGATTLLTGAGTADAAKLPNGSKKSSGIDGQVVTIKRTGERAYPMPSVANNGAGRAAAVSGTYKATLNKGVGTMSVGYLVGCQVDITGLKGGMSGSIGLTSSLSGSISVPLMPGQVALIRSDNMSITKGKATLMVDSFHIDVQQCGGYASARSVVTVMAADGMSTADGTLSGNSGFVQSSLYGKPFSLN
ncbi:MspA family porin [Gordonia alkaliphila]|uniref:MspA family protein n=1 Tax=Gordonia alkaliphila TaxID=1053547 RepID=A0ABP8YT58_9ACTN